MIPEVVFELILRKVECAGLANEAGIMISSPFVRGVIAANSHRLPADENIDAAAKKIFDGLKKRGWVVIYVLVPFQPLYVARN